MYPIIAEDIKTPKYIEKIELQFTSNTSNIQIETKLLARLKDIKKANRPMKISDYLNDNEIYNLLNSLSKDDELYPDALSMAISRYVDGNGNIRSYLQNSVGSLSDEQIENVANCIQYYICYGDLLLQLEQFASMPYVAEVARKLTTNSYGVSSMNIKDVLRHYEMITNCLSLEPAVILKNLERWERFINSVTAADVTSLPLSLIDAMKVNDQLRISEYCLSLVSDYLKALSQDDWKQSLALSDFNFKLLEVYHPLLLPFFVDAFKECMHNYALDDSKTQIPKNISEKAVEILADIKYDVSVIFKDIRDVLIDNSCITIEKLKYFGDFLFKYGHLEDKRQIFNKVIKSEYLGNESIVRMLVAYKETIRKIFAQDENPSDFKNKMKALSDSTYKDDEEFMQLCYYLKIVDKKK